MSRKIAVSQSHTGRTQIYSLVRRFWVLAFLPIITLRLMYNELKEEAASHLQHSAALLQYSAYFPTLPFRKKMWNVHDLAASKRTNNDTEGWNAKWNRAVGKAGPGYYEAVLQLRLQQADTENVLAQVAAGIPPPPRRRKYVRRDERIAGYLARWKSPTEADIQHNDVIDSARLLRILARLL